MKLFDCIIFNRTKKKFIQKYTSDIVTNLDKEHDKRSEFLLEQCMEYELDDQHIAHMVQQLVSQQHDSPKSIEIKTSDKLLLD